MDKEKFIARQWLKKANLTDFEKMLHEMKLTPREKLISIEKFVKAKCNYLIALEHNLCKETIRNELSSIYKKCFNILKLNNKKD